MLAVAISTGRSPEPFGALGLGCRGPVVVAGHKKYKNINIHTYIYIYIHTYIHTYIQIQLFFYVNAFDGLGLRFRFRGRATCKRKWRPVPHVSPVMHQESCTKTPKG